jgi:apolipoprotein N-acyltransferase
MQTTGTNPNEYPLINATPLLPQQALTVGDREVLQAERDAPRRKNWQLLGWSIAAVASFHLGLISSFTPALALVYLFCLIRLLATAPTWRMAFYPGLAVGYLIAAAHLTFFARIFSFGAAALWLVFALWIGLFTLVGRVCVTRLPAGVGFAALPFVWTGLEYFRSELYYLRFSWLSPGYTLAPGPAQALLNDVGVFGVGFCAATMASLAAFMDLRPRRSGFAILSATIVSFSLWQYTAGLSAEPRETTIQVAGVQMEFPAEREVLLKLDELVRRNPEAELLVLPEYTFQEPVPARVQVWCKKNGKYLIVGGTEPAGTNQFYNTAYVVGPAGEVVFRQSKAVPIQFFKDGLPAPEQKVWNSPWGKIGICVCYDLSYTRVTDELVKQGAQVLIVPTMDVADWGKSQHLLHARVAPVRAAEYGIPVFRVATSGVSQAVTANGIVVASAPFPGEGAMIGASLSLPDRGSLPADRWLAPACVAVTGLLLACVSLIPSRTTIMDGCGRPVCQRKL